MALNPEQLLRLYQEAKAMRSVHENDWRMAAAYCLPAHYASWQTQGPANQSQNAAAVRRVAYDTTGTRSLPKYVSILERLATPAGQKWHGITASDPNLRKSVRVRAYFDELTALLFKTRYHPKSRFRISTNEMYMSMGVYGNGPLYIGERKISKFNLVPGIKYVSCALRDVFMLADDEGEITWVFRRFWLNVRQFKAKFGDMNIPVQMQSEANKPLPDENRYFEFVHCVSPHDDYDQDAIDVRRHPYVGAYLIVEGKEMIGEPSGYSSMPYKIPRTATVSGDPYGYSPAVMALSALGGASQMKKTYLKQGNKAVDPPLLVHDDGVMNGEVDQRPGAVNPGGVDRQGRLLVQALPTGNFRVAETLLADERKDIEDSFFVTLFQILTETPQMTATEVMERVAEKASLLAPTMGRLHSEFLGPNIEREIEIHAELGLLPQMPPELVEAQGEYEVVYTSPLAKSMYAEEVSGFMRSVEMALNISQATQNPKELDHFDFDTAIPEIADYMAVPARWMRSPDKVSADRAERATQAQNSELMKNAPALASAAKTAVEMGQGK